MANSVREFFQLDRDELVLQFINDHCSCAGAPHAVLTANDELVLTYDDRSGFFVIAESDQPTRITVSHYTDPMKMIDPDGDPDDARPYSTVADAFFETCERMGFELIQPLALAVDLTRTPWDQYSDKGAWFQVAADDTQVHINLEEDGYWAHHMDSCGIPVSQSGPFCTLERAVAAGDQFLAAIEKKTEVAPAL